MKILLTAIITLGLLFAASFLLDLELIQNNWLRYTTVVLLCLAIFTLGLKMIITEMRQLKNQLENND